MGCLISILILLGAIALLIGITIDPLKTITAFLTLLLVLSGIWAIIDPESAFMFGRRWQFRYAEPSKDALLLTQIGGIIAIIVAILMWLRVLGVLSF